MCGYMHKLQPKICTLNEKGAVIQYASGNNEFDVYILINNAMYTEWKRTNDKKKVTSNNVVSDTAGNNGDDLIKEIDNEEGEMDDNSNN